MVSIRLNSARLVLFAALAFVLFGALAANADAAYRILDYRLTPSNLQAGGHPNVNYKLKPDSGYADRTGGDDLKSVVMDFPAGLLGNPEAATTKCSSSSFNSDTCPLASRIGTIRAVVRFPTGSFMVLDGTVHVLSQVSPGSAATVGFILRPTNLLYRKIFLKTEATGVVTVRTGTDKDYGLTLTVDNIPRTLTTILNTHVSTTVDEITVEVTGRAGSPTKNSDGTYTPKGPYFVYMPTRCGAAISRATAITYQGLEVAQTRSFTPTGCTNVPFSPTASYAISNNDAGQSTGVAATFTVPTAGATIQHSNVKQIQADMPAGSRLDFPAIGNVPELCSEAELNLDECPAGSKIGVVSANVPFLPPTMTGDVYMLSRGLSVQFGYILRGGVGGSVKAPLKGDIFTVDANNDGIADFVRAVTDNMPQVPWSSATINFTTPMLRNPSTCGAHEVKTKMTGWSGKGANLTAAYPSLDCVDIEPPVVTITSPADGSTVNDPSVPVEFTAEDNVGIVACDFESGDSVTLEPGVNTISVSCVDAADNIGTTSVTVTYEVSGAPPTVSITAPIDGSLTNANQTNVAYTVDGGTTIPAGTSCTLNGSPSVSATTNSLPLMLGANTITVTCTNSFGSASDTHLIYRGDGPIPTITSPANNTNTPGSSINVQYTVGGSSTIPAGTACTVNGQSSTSTTTNSVPLAMGSNTITLVCTNAYGSQTSSVVVNRGDVPIVSITAPTNGTVITVGSTINVQYTVNGATTIPPGTTCTLNGQASTNPNNNPVTIGSGTNSITVVCTNSFGASAPASVTLIIGPTPTIAILTPVNGSVTSNSTTNVSFTVNGSTTIPAGTTCTVNGSPTTSTTSNVVPLVAGANTIPVTCTNAFGASTTYVTLTRTTSAFRVTIVSPADGSWTTAASVSPTLSIVGGASTTSCSWRNNGNPTGLPISLVNGVNLIRVDCTNGTESSYDEVTVRRDNISPSVSVNVQTAVTIPENPPAAIISWTVNDDQDPTPANNCVASANGSVLPGAPHTSPISFFPVSGANSVSVSCVDEAGNVGTGAYTYTLPGGPFTLIITSPANGAVISAPTTNVSFAINGSASIPLGMACQINGVTTSSATSNTVALAVGSNTINVSCTAQDGTPGSASVTVQRQQVPSVTIVAPANGTVTNAASTNVSYLVNGAASIPAGHNCTVNGNSSSSTTTNAVSLALGTNSITVACTNAAGTGSANVSVTRMNLPTITGISPATGSTVTTSPINLSFLVNGSSTIPAGVICTVNGASTTSATTNSVALTVGSNTVTIACSNAAGTTTVPVTLLYAPTIEVEILSPTEGAWLSGGSVSPTLSITSPGGSVPGGITCSWTRNGTVVTSPLQLVEGVNLLVVTCTNGIVSDSDSVSVRYDPNPPAVIVSASLNGGTSPSPTATVSWTVTDDQDPTPAGNCTLYQNGTPVLGMSPRVVTVTTGSTVFTVECVDEAGNVGIGSDVLTIANPPTVEITAPTDGSSTSSGSTNVTFLVNGSTSIPAETVCAVNGNQTTGTTVVNVPLAFGSNAITVSCTGLGGTGTDSVTVNRVSVPVVVISSPMNGQIVLTSNITVLFTVNGGSTIPAGTSCTVAGGAVTSTSASVPLSPGSNTILVSCTNGAGTGSAAVSVTRAGDPPNTSVTSFASPSASTARTEAVSFAGTGADSFECRVNSGPWNACTSPWTLPLGSAEFTQGENQYSVRAVNSAGPDLTPVTGFIWVDDRPYNATASVAAEPNDLVADADQANDAGAHPDISASLTLEGYDDPRNVSVKFPDGLMGSLRAIPPADRCSLSQANSGDCPASAQIGVATATAQSSTDGQVTASGTLYLVAPAGLDSAYAAGVAAEFDTITGPVSGDLGDVRAVGGLRLTDQARNITVELTDIPRATTTGNRFHLLTGNLTVFGDAGPDDTKPLITNPHFCNDDGEIFDARPNLKQFVGSGVGWNDEATGEITVDYIIDNCSSVLYEPSLDVSLSNPVAGASTGLSATMSVPEGHGTLRSLQVRLPSFVALNFPSFGVASDMCSGSDDGSGSANNVSGPGESPAYYSFDSSTCPPQSRVGTATLTTPLLDQPLTAYVYLIDKAPVPWLGLEVDPSIPGNPQGVKLGIVAFNSTPQEDPGCSSGCQLVVQSTFPSLPDVPLSSVELEIGGITDRISDGPGNPTLNPNILNIAAANSSSCRNSGTAATTSLVPWNTTSVTTLTDPVLISGCSDPKVNITSPAVPTTGSRINNVANTATTSPLNFTVNGGSTIPAGVTCDINGTPTSSTSNTVSLSTGVNTFTITCADAFGSGTATRRIDRGVPSVRIAAPTANTTTSATASVTLGVHSNGAVLSGALPGTSGTTCNVNGTNVSSLSTAVIIPLVVGSNTLTATCTNSFGTGTATFNITRN